jgi:hypothetical protein
VSSSTSEEGLAENAVFSAAIRRVPLSPCPIPLLRRPESRDACTLIDGLTMDALDGSGVAQILEASLDWHTASATSEVEEFGHRSD